MEYLKINYKELSALNGLPFIQRLVYLQGLRPYVDYRTGIVGLKRGISYQSLSEVLYIEPHQGIQSGSPSKDQLRRALKGLEKAGLIAVQPADKKLVFQCLFVDTPQSVQNKVAIKPPYQAASADNANGADYSRANESVRDHAAIADDPKAATPLYSNNHYVFLFNKFEQFWELYPLKKSQSKAWEIFRELPPSETLIEQIINALKQQVAAVQRQRTLGHWVPNWKNPANWLAQQCWTDEFIMDTKQEPKHATHQTNYSGQRTRDPLWDSCKAGYEDECETATSATSNVIAFPEWGMES